MKLRQTGTSRSPLMPLLHYLILHFLSSLLELLFLRSFISSLFPPLSAGVSRPFFTHIPIVLSVYSKSKVRALFSEKSNKNGRGCSSFFLSCYLELIVHSGNFFLFLFCFSFYLVLCLTDFSFGLLKDLLLFIKIRT